MKELAGEWKALPEAKKEELKQQAKEERVVRAKKFDDYMAEIDAVTLMRFNKQRRKEGKNAIHGRKGQYHGRPTPAFFTFLAEIRVKPEFSGWNVIDLAKEGGRQWQTLSAEEKTRYAPKSAEAKQENK